MTARAEHTGAYTPVVPPGPVPHRGGRGTNATPHPTPASRAGGGTDRDTTPEVLATADLADAIAGLRRWDGEGATTDPTRFAARLGEGEAIVRHLLRILDRLGDELLGGLDRLVAEHIIRWEPSNPAKTHAARDEWRVECSCGWAGPPDTGQGPAAEHWLHHMREQRKGVDNGRNP